jgi:hypothetical protein
MKRTTKKTTAPRKTPQAAQTCAYGDRGDVVATRDTPRGPQPLCAVHKQYVERLGHTTEAVK